ncbi:MAG TPA: glutathione S-transferase family protein [Solirubrobacteraceae bacterium]|nr:glutathione S-transferase family protein [Solirubrobacteraceae bacterium]
MADAVLWHIEISHYNEKARWALDHKNVPHRRRAPMPGVLHPLVALVKTRKPTLPVLELDGEAIGDSTRIIGALERRYPEPPLYPDDPAQRRRALELEDYFDEEVAPNIRRFAFFEISQDPDTATRALETVGGPPLSGRAAAIMVRGTARRYGGSAEVMEESRRKILAGCERLVAEVQPSGYLVGDSFTVADLTAASILSPLVQPPEFQYSLPPFPPAVEEFVATLPAEATDWVRRMWREHRPPSAEVA